MSFQTRSKDMGGGTLNSIRREIRKFRKNSPRSKFVVWLDEDLCVRDTGIRDEFQKIADMEIYFSQFNFEDFLVLHLDHTYICPWENVCVAHGHFLNPLAKRTYIHLFREHVFNGYEKGELPFQLTWEHINRLYRNNDDKTIRFKSSFCNFLKDAGVIACQTGNI